MQAIPGSGFKRKEDYAMAATIEEKSLIFYCYSLMTDAREFCVLSEERFRAAGHSRKIEFRFWNCYLEPPGKDGDIYVYDGMALSALADRGFIRPLPELLVPDGIFEWVLDGSWFEKELYDLPFLVCTDVLISRKEEDEPVQNLFDIRDGMAAPMKSMIGEYYTFAYFNSSEKDRGSLAALLYLLERIGGKKFLIRSDIVNYDGRARFARGECRYLLGFTEDLRYLPEGDYIVRKSNLSDSSTIEVPFCYVNYISIGEGASEEKIPDCIAMLELLSKDMFIRTFAEAEGKMRYILPAREGMYAELIQRDALYEPLYEIASDRNNCVLRCGRDFYEVFPKKFGRLYEQLTEEDSEGMTERPPQ